MVKIGEDPTPGHHIEILEWHRAEMRSLKASEPVESDGGCFVYPDAVEVTADCGFGQLTHVSTVMGPEPHSSSCAFKVLRPVGS